nr:hypothetical protein Iba_chr10eCG1560 [Ipomoea batatas]
MAFPARTELRGSDNVRSPPQLSNSAANTGGASRNPRISLLRPGCQSVTCLHGHLSQVLAGGLVVAEDSTGGHQPSQYLHVDAGQQTWIKDKSGNKLIEQIINSSFAHVVVDSGISPTPFVSFTGRDQLRSSRTTKAILGIWSLTTLHRKLVNSVDSMF